MPQNGSFGCRMTWGKWTRVHLIREEPWMGRISDFLPYSEDWSRRRWSNSTNWWRNPSLGRTSRLVRNIRIAVVTRIFSLIIRYATTNVADLDRPIMQWTSTFPVLANWQGQITLFLCAKIALQNDKKRMQFPSKSNTSLPYQTQLQIQH